MKAKANKQNKTIDIIDDHTKTIYRCFGCTEVDLDTCDLWTDGDCKWWLKEQGGAKIINI